MAFERAVRFLFVLILALSDLPDVKRYFQKATIYHSKKGTALFVYLVSLVKSKWWSCIDPLASEHKNLKILKIDIIKTLLWNEWHHLTWTWHMIWHFHYITFLYPPTPPKWGPCHWLCRSGWTATGKTGEFSGCCEIMMTHWIPWKSNLEITF